MAALNCHSLKDLKGVLFTFQLISLCSCSQLYEPINRNSLQKIFNYFRNAISSTSQVNPSSVYDNIPAIIVTAKQRKTRAWTNLKLSSKRRSNIPVCL